MYSFFFFFSNFCYMSNLWLNTLGPPSPKNTHTFHFLPAVSAHTQIFIHIQDMKTQANTRTVHTCSTLTAQMFHSGNGDLPWRWTSNLVNCNNGNPGLWICYWGFIGSIQSSLFLSLGFFTSPNTDVQLVPYTPNRLFSRWFLKKITLEHLSNQISFILHQQTETFLMSNVLLILTSQVRLICLVPFVHSSTSWRTRGRLISAERCYIC